MTDLIQTLVSRTLGLESPLQPSVGSLYEPDVTAEWERSRLEELVDEVLIRPSTRATAGIGEASPIPAPAIRPGRTQTPTMTAALASPSAEVTAHEEPAVPVIRDAQAIAAMGRGVTTPAPRPRPQPPSPPVPKRLEASATSMPAGPVPAETRRHEEVHKTALPSERETDPETMTGRVLPEERIVRDAAARMQEPAVGRPFSRPPTGALEAVVRRWKGGTELVAPSPGEPESRPEPRAPQTRPEDPAIHVTIGRVDVRAISPPPAAAPAPAPARRPSFPSFEEFLERTSEARS